MQQLRNCKLKLSSSTMSAAHGPPASAFELLQARERQRMTIARTPTDPDYAFYSVARSQRNKYSNRYSDILAYDRTAVGGEDEYLNANVVLGPDGGWWVAAQAPIPSTIHPFLHALATRAASSHPTLQHLNIPNSEHAIIIQLTGLVERGMQKADPYLPTNVGGSKTYGPLATAPKHPSYTLTLTTPPKELSTFGSTYTTLDLSSSSNTQTKIHHYLYHAWPDHGVPTGSDVKRLKKLVYEIAQARKTFPGAEVWVHCSAGVGRTGTFMALSSLLTPSPDGRAHLPDSPLGPLPPDVASDVVLATVDTMRESRAMLVQTVDQLRLIYDIVDSK